jgi:hypothetical protein
MSIDFFHAWNNLQVLKHKNGTINGKVDTNGLGGSTQWQEEFLKTLDERPKSADSTELGFNDDLLCSHGNLCVEESPRRLVQSAVWDIFVRYFPEAPEFNSTNPPCELCSVSCRFVPFFELLDHVIFSSI